MVRSFTKPSSWTYILYHAFTIIIVHTASVLGSSLFVLNQNMDWSWTTSNHSMFFSDSLFRLKGVNWFGFETDCLVAQGLWIRQVDDMFAFLQQNKYNAIRLPFSYEFVGMLDTPVAPSCVIANPWMMAMTARDCMHMFFQKSMQRGIVVLLDLHTIENVISTRPWTDNVSIEQILKAWEIMIQEYGKYPNLIGIDIKNEPHQISWHTWGTYVRGFVKSIRDDIIPLKSLMFVEGIQDHSVWGGSFENLDNATQSFFLSNPHTIVFSPHVYGVSVRGHSAMHDSDETFHKWFGFLLNGFGNAIVIGEIGGFFIDDDFDWHMKIQQYLIGNDIRNLFYWCLNPDSIDTQGILREDWWTPNQEKLDWHTAVQPDPTIVDFTPFFML